MLFDTGIHSTADARRLARKRLPWMVFDYIDGSAGEEHGAALNRKAIQDIRLSPRVLRNVSDRDLSVTLFNTPMQRPFGISPMGMCNLSAPGADLMLAQIAREFQVPHGVSTVASTDMETLLDASDRKAWFQLYFSGDGSGTMQLVERAKRTGYDTLVLTLDVPEVGRRPRELRHGFKMPFRIGPKQFFDFAMHPRWSLTTLAKGSPTLANFDGKEYVFDRTESRAAADWSYFDKLRAAWPGKLVIKGVLHPGDARRLRDAGADAIQVSSHGCRQLDSAPPAILALRHIRAAVGPDFPLFYDSGIRTGEDIVKALVMGADFVFLGRVLLFGIAAGKAAGLRAVWDILSQEVSLTMAQLGASSISDLKTLNHLWQNEAA
ncbi:alpha-hydroxy-acid oxidizing protein [Phaeobacter gallaeciensis]|uniref:Alpha-hydroxy-acid oxidizing protein n=2 Tax=Roseobacteraceae TaxID=2854170 RepID=A0A366XF43_9RHOB|nr:MULTISPECIES: alpha-hydroxy acid oxidase [Roseobacteraceae]MBT3140471.1 alpha-hydroxy-acid oxidizing protein [Falsiruegeria litorea]MBT8169646.1 alpha-hydroxy-acid oxidizing protein [Falsiruegeria litorea]RBW62203.1 alpha-hydroxy-acid oxidizing protein [Phaeobacter gallaeciensis]